MRLSLACERERGLATASLSGARMMSLFAAFAGNGNRGTDSVVQISFSQDCQNVDPGLLLTSTLEVP